MSQSTVHQGLSVKRSLLDAVLAGLIALIVFGPIVGIVLDGYSFNFEPRRLVVIIAVVMAGRLLLSLFLQTPLGRKVSARFEGAMTVFMFGQSAPERACVGSCHYWRCWHCCSRLWRPNTC